MTYANREEDIVDLIDSDDEDIKAAVRGQIPQDPYFSNGAGRAQKRAANEVDQDPANGLNPSKRPATNGAAALLATRTPSASRVATAPSPMPAQYLQPPGASHTPIAPHLAMQTNLAVSAPAMPMVTAPGLMSTQLGAMGYHAMPGFAAPPYGLMAHPMGPHIFSPQYLFPERLMYSDPNQARIPLASPINARLPPTGARPTSHVKAERPQQRVPPQNGMVKYEVRPQVKPEPVEVQEELSIDDCILEMIEIDKYDEDQILIECASIKAKAFNVGGVHFGIVTTGDEVQLIRDTEHSTDPNAIVVENELEISIGNLANGLCKVLAPLMEHSRIQCKGVVSGPIANDQTPFDIIVLTPAPNEPLLRRLLRQFKLIPEKPLQSKPMPPVHVNGNGQPQSQYGGHPGRPPVDPRAALAAAAAAAMVNHGRVQAEETWKLLLQYGSELDQKSSQAILDNVGMKETELAGLPEAPQPDGLITSLLSYQRQGLGWMLAAEHPPEPTESAESQFWLCKRLVDGSSVYYNTATNSIAQGIPRLYRGGILADDMGLGKTIQVLALILSELDGRPFIKSPPSSVSDSYCNTTLIVCPLSVVGNWLTQLEAHTQVGRIRYHVFHGDKRNRDHRYLESMDLVITTYSVMSLAIEGTPLHKVRWRRIVLDEGHNIRAKNTKQAKAAHNLVAERKWVLSGTPLQNKLEDLYSLLKFIEYFPFDQHDIWKSTYDQPIKRGRTDAMDLFKRMMKGLCLRRTKVMKFDGKPLLELPPISYLVHKIPFRPAERTVYAKWEARSRRALAEILRESENGNRGGAGGMGSMLKYLTRLRQLCNHRVLAEKESAQQKQAGGVEQLQALLQENLAEDCPLCLQPMRTPSITTCKHWFCLECVKPLVEATGSCPVCAAVLKTKDGIIELPGQDDSEDDRSPKGDAAKAAEIASKATFSTSSFQSSSKIDALMVFLETARTKDGAIKSVVFSQWTSMLDLLEVPLRARGFVFVRLDGTMTRKVRDSNIERFSSDPRVLVFLVSLTCGSTGLNLVAGTNCFLIDPWWNPQIERQAIDRIYRIGQSKPVTVIRFAMVDSVEERVLLLQETKRQIAQAAFGEEGTMKNKVSKSNRLEDIRALLGKAANGEDDLDLEDESFSDVDDEF